METTRAVAWSWSKGKAHSICDAPAVESSRGARLLGASHDRPTWPCHLNRASSLHVSHPFLLQPLIDSTPSPAKQNLAYKTCRFSEAVPAHLQPSPSPHPQQSSFMALCQWLALSQPLFLRPRPMLPFSSFCFFSDFAPVCAPSGQG